MSDSNNDRIGNSRITNLNSEKISSGQELTHPICHGAVDQEKCERFAERLQQASDNIDAKSTNGL